MKTSWILKISSKYQTKISYTTQFCWNLCSSTTGQNLQSDSDFRQPTSTPSDCKCVENWVKSLSIAAFLYFLSLYLISLCHKQPTRTPRFMRSGGFSSCWRCAVWFCCCWWFLVSSCTDRTGSTRAVEQVTWTKPLQPSHDTSIHPPSHNHYVL